MSPRLLNGPRVPPLNGAATQLVVFLQGYGADGNDLINLAAEFQRDLPTTAFVSPNAPERCPGAGYQWFALSRIDPQELARGVEAAAPVLKEFLDAELARLNLTDDRLALVGFSQGTMMSLHVGLRRKPCAAIIGFSGLLAAPAPAAGEAQPALLLAHGNTDTLIPPGAMLEAAMFLGREGYAVQWHLSPRIPHGIGPEAIGMASRFVAAAFAGRLTPRARPVSCPYPQR
jgi:phospholipase/carboxylesterase